VVAAVVGGAVRSGREGEGENKNESSGALRCSAPVGGTRFGPQPFAFLFPLVHKEGAERRPEGWGGERAVTSELFQWRPLPLLLSSPALCWDGGSVGGRPVRTAVEEEY
jgi:hypothetical protein